jgi:hypothetical protein
MEKVVDLIVELIQEANVVGVVVTMVGLMITAGLAFLSRTTLKLGKGMFDLYVEQVGFNARVTEMLERKISVEDFEERARYFMDSQHCKELRDRCPNCNAVVAAKNDYRDLRKEFEAHSHAGLPEPSDVIVKRG